MPRKAKEGIQPGEYVGVIVNEGHTVILEHATLPPTVLPVHFTPEEVTSHAFGSGQRLLIPKAKADELVAAGDVRRVDEDWSMDVQPA